MRLCQQIKNIVEYLATHKLLVFVSFLSVFNFLCYSISEDYFQKGNARFYWIIALAVLVGIMIGSKAINMSYTKTEKLHEKIVESKRPYWFEKKWIKIVSSCCGIISLVITIIILSVYCPKINLEIDYLGAIAGVLSLFVAVFVGVQIYQSFNLKRDIDEQNNRLLKNTQDLYEKEIEKKFKEWSDDNQLEILSAIYYSQGVYDYNNQKYDDALEKFNDALTEGLKSKYKKFIGMVCYFLEEYESLVMHQKYALDVSDSFLLKVINNIKETDYEKKSELLESFQKIRKQNIENLRILRESSKNNVGKEHLGNNEDVERDKRIS